MFCKYVLVLVLLYSFEYIINIMHNEYLVDNNTKITFGS